MSSSSSGAAAGSESVGDWYILSGGVAVLAPPNFSLSRAHETTSDWITAKTKIENPWTGGEIEVSTVFLFLDHRHRPGGLPILWETLVFGAEGTPMDEYMERYTSEQDARAGHERIVAACRAQFVATSST